MARWASGCNPVRWEEEHACAWDPAFSSADASMRASGRMLHPGGIRGAHEVNVKTKTLLWLTCVLVACGKTGTPDTPTPVAPEVSEETERQVDASTEEDPAEPESPEAVDEGAGAATTPAAPHPVRLGKDPSATPTDAAALYAECEGRVEQPESDGECTTDADCVKAGCSSERCITAASAEGLMGTCEVLPCFEVLDSCGCQEGRCRWSLK